MGSHIHLSFENIIPLYFGFYCCYWCCPSTFVERSAFYLWVFPIFSLCLSCSAVLILYLMIGIVLSISAGICLINYGKFSATISFNIAFSIFYSPPPRIPIRCTLDLLSFSPTIMNFLYIFYNLAFIGYILDKLQHHFPTHQFSVWRL